MKQCPHPIATGQVPRWRRGLRYAAFCALTAWAALLSPARAEPPSGAPAQYEQLLDQAVTAFDAGDFARAHAAFTQAYALRPNARVARGLGIAALRLTRYTEARRWLSSSLTDKTQALTSAHRDEVTKLMAWMDSNLGVLKLRWREPAREPAPEPARAPVDAEVLVDDQPVTDLTLWVSPGSHRVRLRVGDHGRESSEQRVELAAGHEQTVQLAWDSGPSEPDARIARADLAPPPHAAAATLAAPAARDTGLRPAAVAATPSDNPSVFSRWWFWTTVGVVIAGGVTAAVLLTHKPEARGYDSGEGGVLVTRPVEVP